MTFTDAQINVWLASAWFPFIRLTSAIMVAPLFGSSYMPMQVRLLFGVLLTVVIVPVLPAAPGVSMLSAEGMLLSLNEIMIGLCMGFLIQMVFEAVIFAGQTIATGMGLGFAMLVDPQRGVSTPVLSQFFLLISLLLFMALGGHLRLIEVFAGSFAAWPVGAGTVNNDTYAIMIGWISDLFQGSVRIALPAVVALLVVQIGVGVISRAAPTLNLFAVGFPIAMLVGYIALHASLSNLLPILESLLDDAMVSMQLLLESWRD